MGTGIVRDSPGLYIYNNRDLKFDHSISGFLEDKISNGPVVKGWA